ncbi:P2X purinoceptor 7-like [Stylophora pistillata]|uniref:P2X purinoceptor 7 n=1 Tax=Stylophora pistillata TaxID=50429 RepID=A0A2B4SG98_STYPI|nr:P2X purinoceptor 7-like [Stylophora pistillata]PFX27532.1 P2X purinoceptor 7 [Stylophora pistillata]
MSQILPYQLEPEHSSTDERSESEEKDDDSVVSNADTSDRRLNTSWCLCERCAIMLTEFESICSKEPAFLSKLIEGLSCITEHGSFLSVCLNRDVLWTALVSLHDRESAVLPDRLQVCNRSLRYAAYRQFTWWVHGYLGKNIRRVIPSCTVKKIRAEFPAQDGAYAGYITGEEDDSAFDGEMEEAWRDFLNI